MRAHTNGATLHYEKRGAGEPLVLVHGGLASSAMWEPLLPDLIDGFRVITPDSRGHGRSTNPGDEPQKHDASALRRRSA